MVDFEVGTGLRIQAAAVLAGPLGELLVTGGTPEFGSGASDVVDVAFEIGIFQAGLSLIEDGLVTAGLDNPSLVEGQGAEIAVAKTAPVGSEAEFDLAESRDAAIFLIGGVIGAHKGQRVDVVHLLSSQRLRGRVLHDEEFAVVGLVDTFGLEGIRVLMLDRETAGVLSLVAADLLEVGEPYGVVNALLVAGFVDGSVDVGDVTDVEAGGESVGDLRNAVLAHAVGDEVGAGVQKDRAAHFIGPVVVV